MDTIETLWEKYLRLNVLKSSISTTYTSDEIIRRRKSITDEQSHILLQMDTLLPKAKKDLTISPPE